MFTNRDKEVRAITIYQLIVGKVRVTNPGDEYNKDRFTELLKEDKVDLKDQKACVTAIYELLGGRIITEAQAVALKKRGAKNKIGKTREAADEVENDTETDADNDDE